MIRLRTWCLRVEVVITALLFAALLPVLVLVGAVVYWDSPWSVGRDAVDALRLVTLREWAKAERDAAAGSRQQILDQRDAYAAALARLAEDRERDIDRSGWTTNALADQEIEILHLRAQRDDLQGRNTELVLQRRAIAEELERLRSAPHDVGERDRGWMVVRRQRRGTMLANAEGLGDDALVYVAAEDAWTSRGCMSMPKDWDVIEVEVRAIAAADDAKGAA